MKVRQVIFAYALCTLSTACGGGGSGTQSLTYTSLPGDTDTGSTANISAPSGVDPNTIGTNTGSSGNANTTSGTTTAGGNPSTTGGTTGGGTTGGGTTAAMTTAGTTTAGTPVATYSVDNLTADMNAVLQAHTPLYSSDNLGNPANVALWTPSIVQSLYDGIAAMQAFYPSVSMKDLAHLVLALGATDSTGDYRVSNASSVGYLQVGLDSCKADYVNHGLQVNGPNGLSISPTNTPLNDPGANVAIMAWYTGNAVAAGESANEAAQGLHAHVVTRDVGNAMLAWLSGPGLDRHTLTAGSDASNRWLAFYDRLLDYYVQGGFGTQATFDAILGTNMPSTLEAFKDGPAGALP